MITKLVKSGLTILMSGSSILDAVVLALLVSEGANQEMTGEMKSHRIQKAPKGISFILHGAQTQR